MRDCGSEVDIHVDLQEAGARAECQSTFVCHLTRSAIITWIGKAADVDCVIRAARHPACDSTLNNVESMAPLYLHTKSSDLLMISRQRRYSVTEAMRLRDVVDMSKSEVSGPRPARSQRHRRTNTPPCRGPSSRDINSLTVRLITLELQCS